MTAPALRRPGRTAEGPVAWVSQRDVISAGVLLVLAILLGALAAGAPTLPIAALAAAATVALALAAPLTLVLLLIGLTAVLPYAAQNPFTVFIGGFPGLLPSDVLLLGVLLRVALELPHKPLDRPRWLVVVVATVFAGIVTLQCARAVAGGRDVSAVGAEFRHLIGFATLLIAIPLMEDPRTRGRLLGWLTVLGLALGLWGIAQWFLGIDFGGTGDLGVRPGVSFTTSGHGQLQGGMFGFPVAVLLSTAALASGELRRGLPRLVVLAVLITNAMALIFTFERTLWIATIAGTVAMLARTGTRARLRALVWTPVVVVALVVALSALEPGSVTTAAQRLVSLKDYSSDSSVRYRLIESEHVLARIRAHPVTGSGLGAAIYWGRPDRRVAPQGWRYTHNGYFWLSWKLGIGAAALIVVLLAAAVLWRGPPDAEPLFVAVRNGAQAALLAYLVIATAFPIFNELATSALIGLLIAMAAMPRRRQAIAAAGARA